MKLFKKSIGAAIAALTAGLCLTLVASPRALAAAYDVYAHENVYTDYLRSPGEGVQGCAPKVKHYNSGPNAYAAMRYDGNPVTGHCLPGTYVEVHSGSVSKVCYLWASPRPAGCTLTNYADGTWTLKAKINTNFSGSRARVCDQENSSCNVYYIHLY